MLDGEDDGYDREIPFGSIERIDRDGTRGAMVPLDPGAGMLLRGNNDVDRDSLREASARLGLHFLEAPRSLEWAERRLLVTHDPERLSEGDLENVEVLLHGHHHRYVSEQRGGLLRFNPGECAGHVQGLNSVGLLDLCSLTTERVRF